MEVLSTLVPETMGGTGGMCSVGRALEGLDEEAVEVIRSGGCLWVEDAGNIGMCAMLRVV